jgi:hypothetical protein
VVEPQWLTIGREAAARALYEAWHPMRTDHGIAYGSLSWRDLTPDVKARYLNAAQRACEAYQESTLDSARGDLEAFISRGRRPPEVTG